MFIKIDKLNLSETNIFVNTLNPVSLVLADMSEDKIQIILKIKSSITSEKKLQVKKSKHLISFNKEDRIELVFNSFIEKIKETSIDEDIYIYSKERLINLFEKMNESIGNILTIHDFFFTNKINYFIKDSIIDKYINYSVKELDFKNILIQAYFPLQDGTSLFKPFMHNDSGLLKEHHYKDSLIDLHFHAMNTYLDKEELTLIMKDVDDYIKEV